MTRRVVGIIVIALWALGLAFLYKRNGAHSPQQDLAQAGMRVSPDVLYYAIQHNGVNVGAASSSVDTLKDRIVAIDFVRGAFPVGNDTIRLETRSEFRLTRGMRLRDFVIKAIGDMPPFTLRGVMQEGEDKTLRVTTLDGKRGKPITNESIAEQPVFLATFAPMPLMLRGDPKIGDSILVAVFNPLSRAVERVTLRIQADSLFLIPDSVTMDSTSGRWVKAHQSSIRGWKVGSPPPSRNVWVDMSGRMLAAEEPEGLSLVRTTFELSFANWKLDHMPPKPDSTKVAGKTGQRSP